MKCFKRGEKGFTLIELLIVVAILGILAAVVIPNVVGLMGRGGKQAYQTDANTIQLAASTFFSDTHSGWGNISNTYYWGNSSDTQGVTGSHYFPCSIALQSAPFLTLDTVKTDSTPYTTGKNPNNYQVDGNTTGFAANDGEISNSAIWMGLLINAPGTAVSASPGRTARGNVSVLGNDTGLYLQNMPKSAKASDTWNGAVPNVTNGGGSYVWVVGLNGTVYGVYQPGGANTPWYNGFSGSYP